METRIYAVRLFDNLKEKEIASLLKGANASCYAKYENIKINSRAESSLVGNALALFALNDSLGLDMRKIKFGVLPSGKPFLLGYDDVFFSISHSGDMVVCAVSSYPVGVDVEKIRKYNPAVASRFFTPEQLINIENAENKNAAFTKEWTVFEAGAKLTGNGIFKYRYNPSFSFNTTRFEDFFITVATYLGN